MDVLVALTAFAVILPAELPDKTFVATLVLSTRFRPVLVWVGVVLAFGVQTAVAVTAGGLLALLPERAVAAGTAVLFALGSFVLLRSAARADQASDDDERALTERVDRAATPATTRSALAAIGTSFGVLFLAEWGDLSSCSPPVWPLDTATRSRSSSARGSPLPASPRSACSSAAPWCAS